MTFLGNFFSANNIFDCISPWFYYVNVLGCFPYEIITKNNNKELKISKKAILQFFIFYAFLIFSFVWYFPTLGNKKIQFEGMVRVADYLFYPVLGILFLIFNIFFGKKSFIILKKISRIDETFKSINIKIPHKTFKKKLILHLFGASTCMTIVYLIRIVILTNSAMNSLHFSDALTELFRIVLLIRSFTVIEIVQHRFSVINRELLFFSKIGKGCSNVLNEKKSYKFRKLHDELCEVCEIINKIEWFPNFCSLTSMFTTVIANIFFCYNYWFYSTDLTISHVIQIVLLVSHYTIVGFFLIPGFAELTSEVRKLFY